MISPAQMAQIHAASFKETRSWSQEEFADLLAAPYCFAVGDTNAFALVRVIADEAELLTIATDPAHRRQGLARALMYAWHKDAASRGAARALLDVASDNNAALALYASLGYLQVGKRRGYYTRKGKPAADALLFARHLPS